jgi:peptide/nickel transport system ATP-binding protein
MDAPHPLLEVRGLARHFDVSRRSLRSLFGGQRKFLRAVDGVDFAIGRGTTFGLVGESGCGKSTIAKCVVGLYAPAPRSIRFDGLDVAEQVGPAAKRLKRRIQMVYQDPYSSLNPRWRVRDIIAEPIRVHRLLPEGSQLRQRVADLLHCVGLGEGDGTKFPHEFSGGQRQRIAIARALSSDPEFIVCDEPTSALDVSVQAQILNLMIDLQRQFGLTYLFISHNLAAVAAVSDAVGVMYLGRLVERGPARAVLGQPGHPYTSMLLEAVPDVDGGSRERRAIDGELPNPISPPSGCAFHPRCPHANERCRREQPELLTSAGGTDVACHAIAEGRLSADMLTASRSAATTGTERGWERS